MIKDTLEMAINRGCSISLTYSKDGTTTSIIQLTDVSYSSKFGKDYITGFCDKKELTFKIDRIVNVEIEWIDVYNRNVCSIHDGLYLIAFDYCGWLTYELRTCSKGEKILDNHQEKGIGLYGYFPELALAYCYVPFYDGDNSCKWVNISKGINTPSKKGFYVFAFKLDNANIKDKERKWINTTWRCSNDIYYSFGGMIESDSYTYPEPLQNPHIEIIAYYYCSEYIWFHKTNNYIDVEGR